MSSYSIGLSALMVSQKALDLIGQNIANANTPGYHRQVLTLAPRETGGKYPIGVEIQRVARLRNPTIEHAVNVNLTRTNRIAAELNAMREAEAYLNPGEGGLADQLDNFFNAVEQLSSQPSSLAQRSELLFTAESLASQLNGLADNLTLVRDNLRGKISNTVTTVNDRAALIANLNERIRATEITGAQANELRDQRDQAIRELAELIDIRVVEQAGGVTNVLAANVPLVTGNTASRLQANVGAGDNSFITVENSTTALTITGGQLAGMLAARNVGVKDLAARVDQLGTEIIRRVDLVQSTGLGLNGPHTLLRGTRPVSDATIPLASADPAFPIQAGSLFISVTNLGTGERTLTEVAIDPATQSLQDLAGAITAATGGQVQGSVTSGNTLDLQAQAGFAFDFAGQVPSQPQNIAMGGTAIPSVSGVYAGSSNDNLSFSVVGSGTVGVSPSLTLEVRDGANNLVGSFDIGENYTPETPLNLGNGLSVRLGAGTTASGTFSVPTVASPDTAGVLPALGVNTFFEGTNAAGVRVRPDLLAQPESLSASRGGGAEDSLNLERLTALRDNHLFGNGTQTFQEYLSAMVGDVGAQVSILGDTHTAQTALGIQLFAQEQSVSGVDPNEEALMLVQYERSFQMAARYLEAVNTTLGELITIVN